MTFLSGGENGKESSSKFLQIVDRTHTLAVCNWWCQLLAGSQRPPSGPKWCRQFPAATNSSLPHRLLQNGHFFTPLRRISSSNLWRISLKCGNVTVFHTQVPIFVPCSNISVLPGLGIPTAAAASRFSRVWLCATPEMAAHQAPPSLGFSRQEHWSGLPFPSPMHKSEKWKWSHSVVSDS